MKRRRQGQQGFTLIEIIAVIVLLGVLAAVLVPKYTDLTADARNKAAAQAIAEGQARVNAAAARYILATGTVPATYTALTNSPAGNTLVHRRGRLHPGFCGDHRRRGHHRQRPQQLQHHRLGRVPAIVL